MKKNEVHELIGKVISIKADITQGQAGPELKSAMARISKDLPRLKKGNTIGRARGIVNLKPQLLLILPKSPAHYTPKHHAILRIIENAEHKLHGG